MMLPLFPLQNELAALMRAKNVPGIALAAIQNAEIAAHMEWGLKNAQKPECIDEFTLFEAASLSKPVFAYGVFQLLEMGQIDLDTPLIEYLRYADIEHDDRSRSITARMVLTHSAGFPNWRPKNEILKIHFQPGERFSYSGEGFLYLQRVVEHISGLSLEDYMQKNVLIPLGMAQSTFIWSNEPRKATGHHPDGTPHQTTRDVPQNAAFTLHTTPLDYAKFVIAVLNEKGLSAQMIHEMLRPQIQVQESCPNSIETYTGKLSDSVFWGLGWGIQRTEKGDIFWHWGDNGGFKSFIWGSKKNNQAMILFTNSSNGMAVISEILKKSLSSLHPAFDWIEKD